MTKSKKATAAQKAIEIAGGSSALSERLSDLLNTEISYDRVNKWKKNGVSPYCVLPVAQITGLPLYELDSRLYPKYLFRHSK